MSTIILDRSGAPGRRAPAPWPRIGHRGRSASSSARFSSRCYSSSWEAGDGARLEPPIMLPSPRTSSPLFRGLFSSSDIWADFAASGKSCSTALRSPRWSASSAASLIGWYPRLGYFFDPFVNFLYAIPRVALGPLLVVWLGIGLEFQGRARIPDRGVSGAGQHQQRHSQPRSASVARRPLLRRDRSQDLPHHRPAGLGAVHPRRLAAGGGPSADRRVRGRAARRPIWHRRA